MITGELRNKIDKIWETFWTGGITNPLDVIEQFTYLLFIKQLDEVETTKENEANFLGVDYESMFPGECQKYRWSKFKNLGSAEEMYELVLNGVNISKISSLGMPCMSCSTATVLCFSDSVWSASFIFFCSSDRETSRKVDSRERSST